MDAASWCSSVPQAVTVITQDTGQVVRRDPYPPDVRPDILISLVAWGLYGIDIRPLSPCECDVVTNALPGAGPTWLRAFGPKKAVPVAPLPWASLDALQQASVAHAANELWASVPAEVLTVRADNVLQVEADVLLHPCGARFREYLRGLYQRDGAERSAHFVSSLKSARDSTGITRTMQQLVGRGALIEGGIFKSGEGVSFHGVVETITAFLMVHPCRIRKDETELIRMKMDMIVLLEHHTQRSAPPGLPSGRRFSTAPIVYTSTPGVVCGIRRLESGRHVVIAPLSAKAMVSQLQPAGPEDLDALFGYDSGGRNICVGVWMSAMMQTLEMTSDSRSMVISTCELVPSSVVVMTAAAPGASTAPASAPAPAPAHSSAVKSMPSVWWRKWTPARARLRRSSSSASAAPPSGS